MTPDQYISHLHTVYEAFALPFELMPPASEQDLLALQHVSGSVDPLLATLWRITQGSSADQAQPFFQRPGFVDALDLLTPRSALMQAEKMQQRAQRMLDLAGPASADERLTGRWWEPGWLPFASFYDDIVLLVDYHPGPKGKCGQIIAFIHDPDEISWIAPDFAEYLQVSSASIDQDREEFLSGSLEEL